MKKKKKKKAKSVSLPPIKVNLIVACPVTGYIKSSCGCFRCINARKNNRRVR